MGSVQDYTTQFQNIVGQVDGMGDLDQVAHYLDYLDYLDILGRNYHTKHCKI